MPNGYESIERVPIEFVLMGSWRLALAVELLLCAGILLAQKDKNTQTLNVPKDPPLVAVGEAERLVFHVSPLSGNGLLSQQTRDALKAILKLNHGDPIVHIRAFSAGNGDVRRIPQIVSDVLGDSHGPLPSISVLQAGALTSGDAQVVLETISVGRKVVNKDGVTFHAAQTVVATEPNTPLTSLLQQSVDQLTAKMNGHAPLSVTCFVSALDDAPQLLSIVTRRFPNAATDLVQPRRLAWQTEASCEGVSQGGGLTAPRLAFSGTQVAFGVEEKDAALAVQRLGRALDEAGARRAVPSALLRLYLLNPGTAAAALKPLTGPESVSIYSVEGVGSMTAGFAIDAVVPVR